jgi:hypothetical protein
MIACAQHILVKYTFTEEPPMSCSELRTLLSEVPDVSL